MLAQNISTLIPSSCTEDYSVTTGDAVQRKVIQASVDVEVEKFDE